MKKSLILSIVMTLVLVISMSTATFAWYTANDTVTANTAQVTASTAAGNLKISKDNSTWATTITFDAPAAPTAPMMPTAADLSAFATAIKASDGTITYSTGASAQTYTFYLSNVDSDALTLDFSVTPTDGTDTSSLRYAILQGTTIVESSAFDYLTSTTAATEDAKTAVEAANTTYEIATNASSVEFKVLLWHDGATMVNAEGGKTSSINISISKAA